MNLNWTLSVTIFVGLTGIVQNALGISFQIDSEDLVDHIQNHRSKLGQARMKRFVQLRKPDTSEEMKERFQQLQEQIEQKHSRFKGIPSTIQIQPSEGGRIEDAIEVEDLEPVDNSIETDNESEASRIQEFGVSGRLKASSYFTQKSQQKLQSLTRSKASPIIFRHLLPSKSNMADPVTVHNGQKRHLNYSSFTFLIRPRNNQETYTEQEAAKQIQINHKNWRKHVNIVKNL